MDTEEIVHSPVPVTVKNWDDSRKPKVCSTSFQTYALDPTTKANASVQIATFEPTRERLIIQVLDANAVLYLEQPKAVPEVADGVAIGYSGGRILPASTNYDYCFYGNDAMWINSITGKATRITVTKEYRA